MQFARSKKNSCKTKTARAALYVLCTMLLIGGAVLLSASAYYKGRAIPKATPGLAVSDIELSHDSQGFPIVDWDFWKQANPDIIGWVTVPDTSIDLPIVQARADESAFYLTHDIYREWNFLGCPYLDAECETAGLDSRCAMVYGHNSADGSMFADFANYSDQAFAEAHSKILLQTPSTKRILQVAAISLVKGNDTGNKLRFDSDAEFSDWYKDRIKSSFFQLGSLESANGASDGSAYERSKASDGSVCERSANNADKNASEIIRAPDSVVAFCTCSYNLWPDDERTIIYALDSPTNRNTYRD